MGADFIRARVYYYKYNAIKHDNYNRVQCMLSEYTKFMRLCNFQQERRSLEYEGWPVCTYEIPEIYNYLDEREISNLKSCLDKNIIILENILNSYFALVKIPDKWRIRLIRLFIYFSKGNKYTYETLAMLREQGWTPHISVGEWKQFKNKRRLL
ncbi:hypothetical protein CUU66_10975 [Peribacillus deserti]|uniref:Uncharacterized protein n=1 Tax=Peribacillus deserti TaxID=673318 RepID=A0A2N5M629_9BACI|nr:hypothetical protein CUU66_10975 [Peribacillus deserti]